MKVHFRNFLNWKSLPETFYLKRTWNRYDDRPVDAYESDIPATTIGRFLAKIRYHYIPAVRSREIFSDLLADLHDTLLQDETAGLRKSSDTLVTDLHRLTTDMSHKIKDKVRIESTINLPESLQDLFRALNFNTKFGEHDIALNLRGDGIQSRHLPFILNYISEKSDKYHVWGYEEAENSMELSRIFDMATDFRDLFSNSNQIFLTTHSPAFYDISGPKVAKWNAESINNDSITSTHLTPITSTSYVDETLGLLNVVTPRMKKLYEESENLKSSIERLREINKSVTSAVAYVEGPSDVKILEAAATALRYHGPALRFAAANGAGDITQFLKLSSRMNADSKPIIGLFDADARGRQEMDKFRNHYILKNSETRVVDKSKKIYALSLPIPHHLEDALTAFKTCGIGGLPLCIEFMFENEVLEAAMNEGAIAFEPRIARVKSEELPFEVSIEEIISSKIDSKYKYLCRKISDGSKGRFANWISQQSEGVFEPFRPLFEHLSEVLSID